MRRDSFYCDFDSWTYSNHAPQAALLSKKGNGMNFRHEYWLIAIGLEETSWFIYCEKYDVAKGEKHD